MDEILRSIFENRLLTIGWDTLEMYALYHSYWGASVEDGGDALPITPYRALLVYNDANRYIVAGDLSGWLSFCENKGVQHDEPAIPDQYENGPPEGIVNND